MEHLDSATSHVSGSPPVSRLSVASGDLDRLLEGWSELRQEIARLRDQIRQLEEYVVAPRLGEGTGLKAGTLQTENSFDQYRQPSARRGWRPAPANHGYTCPVDSKLGRACRIALMETNEAVSVETIYDRIARRGSFTFVDYKHPFRAIVLAMSAMVRDGEASLLNEEGRRRWRWEPRGRRLSSQVP
jgi:hypothetical protein